MGQPWLLAEDGGVLLVLVSEEDSAPWALSCFLN